MDLLWVATKLPWPPIDGGRLLMLRTMEALSEAGVAVTLVAPFDPAVQRAENLHLALQGLCHLVPVPVRPMGKATGLVWSVVRGKPLSLALHDRRRMRIEVARLASLRRYDLIQAEQLQAFAAAAQARCAGIPVVLRCQNVECDLWRAVACLRPWLAPLLRREALRLERAEAQAVRACAATIALTGPDAERLSQISGSPSVHHVAAPFPAQLPPARGRLSGAPAVVLLGGRDWLPNRDAAGWFVREVWPRVQARLPDAVLHQLHGAGLDSREAFPAEGGVLAVPLRVASGVRMKILEAWARGVPVVATPVAAAGLEARDGRELLLAATPEEFASAIEALHRDRDRALHLVQAGRAALREHHDPQRIATRLCGIYAAVTARGAAP